MNITETKQSLKELMRSLGISENEVARRLNKPQPQVNRTLKDGYPPVYKALEEIANSVGYTLDIAIVPLQTSEEIKDDE